jgi:hypothetical protein
MIRKLRLIIAGLAILAMAWPTVPLRAAAPPVAPARPPATPLPAPAPKSAKTSSKPKSTKSNPHLHLPPTPTASRGSVSNIPSRTMTRRPLRSHPCHRHHLTRTQYFGGVVTGEIHDGRGAGVTGAYVQLAKWRGGRLRHNYRSTISGVLGHYTLAGVRSGHYRVVASRTGVGKGSTRFAIQHGVKHVNVKLGSGGGKKRKKR